MASSVQGMDWGVDGLVWMGLEGMVGVGVDGLVIGGGVGCLVGVITPNNTHLPSITTK